MNTEQKDIVLKMMIYFNPELFKQFSNDSSSKELRLSRFYVNSTIAINT